MALEPQIGDGFFVKKIVIKEANVAQRVTDALERDEGITAVAFVGDVPTTAPTAYVGDANFQVLPVTTSSATAFLEISRLRDFWIRSPTAGAIYYALCVKTSGCFSTPPGT